MSWHPLDSETREQVLYKETMSPNMKRMKLLDRRFFDNSTREYLELYSTKELLCILRRCRSEQGVWLPCDTVWFTKEQYDLLKDILKDRPHIQRGRTRAARRELAMKNRSSSKRKDR